MQTEGPYQVKERRGGGGGVRVRQTREKGDLNLFEQSLV